MASLRLYGANCASTERLLASQGACIVHDSAPDLTVLRRAVTHNHLSNWVDPKFAGDDGDVDRLTAVLASNPEALSQPFVVRGRSYMVGSDPSRLQSLMY